MTQKGRKHLAERHRKARGSTRRPGYPQEGRTPPSRTGYRPRWATIARKAGYARKPRRKEDIPKAFQDHRWGPPRIPTREAGYLAERTAAPKACQDHRRGPPRIPTREAGHPQKAQDAHRKAGYPPQKAGNPQDPSRDALVRGGGRGIHAGDFRVLPFYRQIKGIPV